MIGKISFTHSFQIIFWLTPRFLERFINFPFRLPFPTKIRTISNSFSLDNAVINNGRFFEGDVNQSNRLMSSSSALRYQNALNQLGQSAENVLGGTSNLVPGYTTTGNLPGSMEDSKQTQYAQTLSNIAAQQRAKNAYNQPLDYNFPDYSQYNF